MVKDERILRSYRLKKARLTRENLRRSLTGAEGRAQDCVCVMVNVRPGVKVPRQLDCMSRSQKWGCLFDLTGCFIDKDELVGWGLATLPGRGDDRGVWVNVPLAAMTECRVSYIEKAA